MIGLLIEHEKKVYSQNGEDGILEWLAPRARTKLIVEIGYDPVECNSRNLVEHHGWVGWLFDAKFGEWITAENVNEHIVDGDIGIFSLDIDGNDYWVWKALKAKPDIVCIEYNAHLGTEPWVLQYDPEHRWDHTDTHGASIAALCKLAAEKGYQCLGCDSKGVNAFFIKKELGEGLPDLTPEEAYRPPLRRKKGGPDYSRMVSL